MIKVGDYVTCRGLMGVRLFAKVKSIEDHDSYPCYVIEGPEGEFKSYGAEKLTQKEAKAWITRFQNNIKFLKDV